MKFAILLAAAFFASSIPALQAGETFIGPTTPENRLILGEGELLIFSSIGRCNSGCDGQLYFIQGSQTNSFLTYDLARSTMVALAGPGEIIGEDQFIVSFQRIQNSGAKTLFVPFQSTNTVEISANSSIRFLPTPGGRLNLLIKKNDRTIALQMFGGEELYGPLTLGIRNESFLTYIISESPAATAPQPFSGHLNFTIEKSPDLKQWDPAFLFQSSEESPSFFRLSVIK